MPQCNDLSVTDWAWQVLAGAGGVWRSEGVCHFEGVGAWVGGGMWPLAWGVTGRMWKYVHVRMCVYMCGCMGDGGGWVGAWRSERGTNGCISARDGARAVPGGPAGVMTQASPPHHIHLPLSLSLDLLLT